MGTISLTVEGSTVGTVATGGGVVATYTVSDVDSARLVAAMADFYSGHFRSEAPADGSPRGPRGGARGGVPFTPTIEQVVRAWFDDVVRTALNQTRDYELRTGQQPVITVNKA